MVSSSGQYCCRLSCHPQPHLAQVASCFVEASFSTGCLWLSRSAAQGVAGQLASDGQEAAEEMDEQAEQVEVRQSVIPGSAAVHMYLL